jgi:hypothetical protein
VSAPSPATVVLERVQGELRRLRDTQRALLEVGPAKDRLRAMAGDRLVPLVGDVRGRLEHLERGVRAGGVTRERLMKLADLQRAVDRVTSECLALALGALARQFELDDGACDEADLFIRDLASRIDGRFARPTVPSDAEHLHRAADVIRRRVPDLGLWDLPVMAHEFGHLVASGLTAYDAIGDQVLRPVESLLDRFADSRRQQVTELFCDVFATFSLGPSYPCSLVMHRLDPTARAVAPDAASHPGDAARVEGCLRTLERMSGGSTPLARVHWQLGTVWRELQGAAPSEALLDEAALGKIRSELSACWAVLDERLSVLRYRWSDGVRDLVDELARQAGERAPAGYSAADVLNAAWVVRLDAWADGRPVPDHLEIRARRLLHRALGG